MESNTENTYATEYASEQKTEAPRVIQRATYTEDGKRHAIKRATRYIRMYNNQNLAPIDVPGHIKEKIALLHKGLAKHDNKDSEYAGG